MVKKAKIATPVATSSGTNYTTYVGKERAELLFIDAVERAENGEVEYFKIVADRLYPKSKSGNFFRFRLPVDATPAEQIASILQAVAKAQIDIDSAGILISSITKYLEVQKSNYDFNRQIKKNDEAMAHYEKYKDDKDPCAGIFDNSCFTMPV